MCGCAARAARGRVVDAVGSQDGTSFFVEAGQAAGLPRERGDEQLTDELLGTVGKAVQPSRPGHGQAWETCQAHREQFEAWFASRRA